MKRLAAVSGICLMTAAFSDLYAAPVILTATEDVIILDGSSSNNLFPNLLASELETSGPGTVWMSVLKFDLSSITGNVNTATFELTSFFNHSSGTFSHQVFSSTDDSWTENTVTGINRPGDSTFALLDSTNIDAASRAYTWNVLAGVTGSAGLAGTNNVLTLVIRPDLSQAGNAFGPHFFDRGASAGFPRLLLDVGPTAIPEPGSLALFITGLLGGVVRRMHLNRNR